ncbi:MAG TPA: hypothetical protein VKT78_06930 [Fimbriimonadaceae bacterium]|nr:hypothetical protein [Fimbriimonadaceae bacterium]
MALLPFLFLAMTTAQPSAWTSGPDGDLALVPFKSAPYPHASRAEGLRTKTAFYPREEHYSDPTVGVFVPKGFRSGRTVNFVVHFHGHNNHVEQVFQQYDLPRQMHASGLNAVLLVPQGPRDVPDSGFGKLENDPGSLEAMLQEALGFLATSGRVPTGTRIGHVALTTHSGGFWVTASILGRNELAGKLTDVILFDSSYGGLAMIADWCAADSHRRLISICTDHLGHRNAQLIALLQKRHVAARVLLEEDLTLAEVAKRGVLIVLTTTLEHNDVIAKRNYFADWLRPCGWR